jgi:simple sugar transport system permease protein
MAGWFAVTLAPGAPALLLMPLALLFGVAGGAGLASIAAGLRTRYGVNEIIATVMLNYVVVYLLSWLLSGGPWGEVGATVSYQQSPPAPEAARLPTFDERGRLHLGFPIAILASLACAVLMARTPLGFEIRAMGGNAEALRRRGVDVGRLSLVVMALSGALAGLAGISETLGVTHRLRGDELHGLGYAGIVIGLIGGLRPLGVAVAGLFFGGLANGAVFMSVLSDAPAALAQAIQGVLLISILCGGVAARARFRRTVPHVA